MIARDLRMRKLSWEKEPNYPYMSKVVYEKGTWGTETSYVPTGKEREIDS